MSMERVLPNPAQRALHDVAATRRLEARAAAALSAHTLMRRAGVAVARLALALAPHAGRVWIAAGPGNNGGDGLEAALHLLQAGRQVEIALLADPARLPPDAAQACARARAAGARFTSAAEPERTPQLAIDALLGIGAVRAPEGVIALAVRALNALACPVLAVDLPSGLDADTGQAFGSDAVMATHTLALLTLKPGLLTAAGRDHAGLTWFDALGVDATPEPACAWLSAAPGAPAGRRHAGHKGSFGDVAVVGGATGMVGAALLAARAAHAAGAGRVHVELLDRTAAAPAVDLLRPELMLRAHWSRKVELSALARTTVVAGCGGGEPVRAALPRLLGTAKRLVLDADALNALAVDTHLATLLAARAARGAATILTPHPLEAARLLGLSAAEVQRDRLGAARALAERWRCVVVLKGSGSVIAAPDRTPRLNGTGNAALATAGTGDVLAGWVAGRWAPVAAAGDETDSAFRVACLAVAEHGAAAEPPPAGPLRAGDLIERLAAR